MFRKLRVKIALSSMAVLLALFLGTIALVYTASYRETLRTEQDMLGHYARGYWNTGGPEKDEQFPAGPPPGEALPDLPMNAEPPGDSQFASVEWDEDGNVVSVHNPDSRRLSDDSLIDLAGKISVTGRDSGTDGAWVYRIESREGRRLVTLLDNTLVSNSSFTLFSNTVRYGAVMIVLLSVVVWFTSGLLVRPLEQNELEQKRFLSDAGHELKTPIAVIATNAELLERDVGQNRWLDNIRAENERAGNLVKSLLTLSRAEEKSTPLKRLNLSALSESVILPFEGVAYEKGHLLHSRLQPDLYVSGSEQQLTSLLSILLDNAVQYSLEESGIDIDLAEENRRAVLRVSNRSEEVSPEQCRQMFDRFYRSSQSRTGDGHYGLGLSIAQKITAAHHGTISAAWKDGVMVFRVALPISKA